MSKLAMSSPGVHGLPAHPGERHSAERRPSELLVLLRLFTTRGIGPRTIARLLEETRGGRGLVDLEAISAMEREQRFKLKRNAAERFLSKNPLAERLLQDLGERGVSTLFLGDAGYPRHLGGRLSKDAPPILFALGNMALLERPAVGVAGSRRASEIGLRVAAECARSLAKQRINVVGGYASGIDMASHRAALHAGGVTTLVLAEGILQFQVKRELSGALTSTNSLVVSEFSPGLPWSVAQAMGRNRTIVGLSDAMVIVESGESGGTMDAGRHALQMRVPLFVLDYAEPNPAAPGNARLLRDGARPLHFSPDRGLDMSAVLEVASVRFSSRVGPSAGPLFDRTA